VDDAERVCVRLVERGVLVLPAAAGRIRAVTHLGIETEDIDEALKAISQVVGPAS
jgi:acetylornithine/succinyldiaminopimelate/putrescine aminotransferase